MAHWTLSVAILVLQFLKTIVLHFFNKISIAFLGLIEGLSMKAIPADEVESFDKLSEHWWDLDGPMGILHNFNKLRVPYVVDCMIARGKIDKKDRYKKDALQGFNILDVGCGGGILTEELAKLRGTVVGIDPAEHLIEVAKTHLQGQAEWTDNCQYYAESMEQHAGNNGGKYDIVILSETIEHVVDKSAMLQDVAHVLKPGGSILITTWDKTNWAWVLAVVVLENIMKRLPKGSHDYEKFLPLKDAIAMLDGYECKTIDIRYLYLKFWEDEWIWVPFTKFLYALHAVKAE